MALDKSEKAKLERYGLSGLNKPKRTPKHSTKSFKARHGKNIAKGPTSAAYWANKVFWSGKGGSTKSPPKSQKHKKGVA
mgnify:CR=1 FL=1